MSADLGSPALDVERSASDMVDTPPSLEQPQLAADEFLLPDLVSHCDFPLVYHPEGDAVAADSVRWMDENCPMLNEKRRKALYGLQAGELTAFCYNYTTPDRLRVVADFLTYLFHLDNISDGMMTGDTHLLGDLVMNALWDTKSYRPTHQKGREQPAEEPNAAKLARDFWGRCIADAKPGCQSRFRETFEHFFEAVNHQAADRDKDVIPDLESYINYRRDTSGCKPCWALVEYALDIDLPDEVAEHPTIMALGEATNDLVTWSNDIFSYNVEQARGDTHNMIVIFMVHSNMTLQEAMERVGTMCADSIKRFNAERENLPSWGPEVDDMVQRYVQGLQDWIVGSLHWSFQTARYFGTDGETVKKTRRVKLLPVREDAKW
ncbi:Alpha-muurolene synthase [Marasmius crinis-equi]|uniref:Terpene synthase n=1 Tax=Marasmius crinis-equi TaxID=585013 RepID=A0ABR3F2G3_9AGAR